MGKLYCLMGKSGSGKDSAFKEIIKTARITPVVTYTTRPIRHGEETGRDYFFITADMLEAFEKSGKVIEVRNYNTVYGLWSYATVDDGNIDFAMGDYILITTLEAYYKISRYFGGDNVKPIYIEVEDGLRLERAIKRERAQPVPGYAEICRRFLADSEDFNSEKLALAGVEKCYSNISLFDCVDEIMKNEGLKKA